MYNFDNYFNSDKKVIPFNSFENESNLYENNSDDEHFEDSLYANILINEEENNEILNPEPNHKKDFDMNESKPSCFKLNDSGIDKEFKEPEIIPDENENHLNEFNEKFQQIGTNGDLQTKEKIFKSPRIEAFKKFLRAKVNKWYIPTINNAIKESDLPKNLKKKIYRPPNEWTEKVTRQTNFDDLQKSMKTILCIGKETKKYQRKNYDNIQSILTRFQKKPSKSVEKIIMLFQMTYEEAIEMFYESKEFMELKNDDTAMKYDEMLKSQKGISIFEEKGLVRVFKSYFTPEGKKVKVTRKKRRI
jgi:hypothetical protein